VLPLSDSNKSGTTQQQYNEHLCTKHTGLANVKTVKSKSTDNFHMRMPTIHIFWICTCIWQTNEDV